MPTSTRTRPSEPHVGARPRPSVAPLAPPAGREHGFTLLELSIVLLVVAIAASFLIPRLRNVDSAALGSAASRLATTSRYLYEEAAFRRRPMRLNLDLDKHAYWVTVLNDDPDDPEFVVEDSPIARPVALPGTVAFADVTLPAVGMVHEGVVFAQFFPEGYADPLVVHLTNARHEYATLAIEPLTGRTRVADAYVQIDPARVAAARDPRHDGTRGHDDSDSGNGFGGRSSMRGRGADTTP
ncbi:MAG TPA: prepilin-type N-terminal cleavage/methylation domain-containing protein [Candidatus Binatia bacterium]|jgi:general secretion pathway protein H